MTAPEPHGYTDYGRTLSATDKVLINESIAGIVGSTTRGPFFVGDMPFLGILFATNSVGGRIHLEFYREEAMTTLMGSYQGDLTTFGNWQQSLGVLGLWLKIVIDTNVALDTLQIKVWTQHSGINGLPGIRDNLLISAAGTVVGAGATVNFDYANAKPGPAVWNVFSTLATWTATLSVFDYLGALFRIDTINQTNANPSRPLFLPPAPIRLSFTNPTGAASNIAVTVMSQPFLPGS